MRKKHKGRKRLSKNGNAAKADQLRALMAPLREQGLSWNAIASKLAGGMSSPTGKRLSGSLLSVIAARTRARNGSRQPTKTEDQGTIKYEPGFAKFILYSSELDDPKKISMLKLLMGGL